MNDTNTKITPSIRWDTGTAYDLFTSLYVIHHPDDFGLRSTWAAGVRSRFPSQDRDIMEDIIEVIGIPLLWLYELPSPKDAFTALYKLKTMDPDTCLVKLACWETCDSTYVSIIKKVSDTGTWTKDEFNQALAYLKTKEKKPVQGKKLERMLNTFSKAREYGAKIPTIFQTYYNVFYQEEEARIRSTIETFLKETQLKTANMSVLEIVEQVSRGIQFKDFIGLNDLILVPSYWVTPLVMYSELYSENDRILLFGARPDNESLIPGEIVPDNLVLGLKSLADPTRLQIMRYLVQGKYTQADLSRKLRLRAPTITHHLHELRLAGLVGFEIEGSSRYYTARKANIHQVFSMLNDFLEKS